MAAAKLKTHNDNELENRLVEAGFVNLSKIADTLQGSVWRALQYESNQNVVVKVTSKYLHRHSIAIAEGATFHNINEDILSESKILKYLTQQKNVPQSLTKYYDFFESDYYYFLVMEDGGTSLFDFIARAHRFVSIGTIQMSEWHKVIQIIFKQIIECIEFIHSKYVCHFDISLENFVVNDVQVKCVENSDKIEFVKEDIQIKLCDFGLAEMFDAAFHSNKCVGKQPYKSPEIVNKKKDFDAKANDIWCVGIMLFMMVIGSGPWSVASKSDNLFMAIFYGGYIRQILKSWNKHTYVDNHLIELFQLFFRNEDKRITIQDIKKHPWIFNSEL